MWEQYYKVIYLEWEHPTLEHHAPMQKEGYVITYTPEGEKKGLAYNVWYRTERLAKRGAERLYRRVHGNIEEILQLTD